MSSPFFVAGSSAYARHRRRLAALLVATALAPAALPLLPDSGLRIGIAQAYAKESVTIDKLTLPTKTGSITLSGISLTGSSLGRSDIEALLKSSTIIGLADRLEKLDADRIAIGSIEWALKSGAQDMVTTYEGLEATGVKAGAIDLLVMKGGRQTAKIKAGEKTQNSETAFGKFTMEKTDLAGLFRWMVDADPTGKAPMKQLHGRYELESMDMKMDEANIRVGRMVAAGFKAKLARTAPIEIMTTIETAQVDPKSTVNNLKMLAQTLDVYSSFEFGDGSVDGFRATGKDTSTGGQVTVNSGKITFAGGSAPNVVINDIDIKAQDGYFKMKKAGMQGDAYAFLFMGIKEGMSAVPATEKPGDPKAAENARAIAEIKKMLAEATGSLVLKDIGVSLEGVDGDLPPGKDAKSKDRVKLGLASFKATMGGFVNLSPTRIDYALNNLVMPIPANSTDKGIQTLREFGIDVLDLSARIKGTWDEAKSRFVVDDIMADLAKFGQVSLKGELGNIPRPLFENPVQNWPVVMMSGNVQSLTLTVNNKGGAEKMIARAAGEQKKTADQFKLEMSAIAPMLIGTFMAGHPDATKLSEALTKFIKTPGTLSVTARANVPTGITVMDFSAASQNPAVLLQKLKIEASAK